MAIFLPTKITGDIVVYSKWCVQCEQPDDLLAINIWALHNNLDVQVIRTAYRPADHRRAVELWSCRGSAPIVTEDEDYPTFVVYQDQIKSIKYFIETMIKDAKNKMVTEGKTKDDVQRLPKAKRAARKNRVASKVRKSKASAKERAEG